MKRLLEEEEESGEQLLPWDVFGYITQFILLPYQLGYEYEEDEYRALRTASRYGRACRSLKTVMQSRLNEWREMLCCRVCQCKLGQIHCNCRNNEVCLFRDVPRLIEPNSLCLTCVPEYCAGCRHGSCGCVEMECCDTCNRPFCCYCRHNPNIFFVYYFERTLSFQGRHAKKYCRGCNPQ